MRREAYRKLLHIASILIPLGVWVLPRPVAIAFLLATALVAIVVEWSRLRVRWVRYHFLRRTRTLLRTHERHRWAGATFMAVAYLLALLVFPKPIAVAAMLFNGLGDAAAALVGKRFGRHRLRSGKSWEGAGAALAVTLGVGLLMPGIPVTGAVAGALAATMLELAALPPDDNLWITLGGGAGLWAGSVFIA